jgi:hypothetical protein
VLERIGVLTFAAGEILLGAVVPGAGERLAVRSCKVRQVTSTRAPPSGMERSFLPIPL